MKKNVVIITSSPRGSRSISNKLSEEFKKGAMESGNSVTVIDSARANIGCCLGCDYCIKNGKCVQNDDFAKYTDALINADVVVFASPIYYFDVTAQIKKLIDRFYSINSKLMGSHKDAYFILACADDTDESVSGAVLSLNNTCKYLKWNVKGSVVALSSSTVGSIKESLLNDSFTFGKNC